MVALSARCGMSAQSGQNLFSRDEAGWELTAAACTCSAGIAGGGGSVTSRWTPPTGAPFTVGTPGCAGANGTASMVGCAWPVLARRGRDVRKVASRTRLSHVIVGLASDWKAIWSSMSSSFCLSPSAIMPLKCLMIEALSIPYRLR